MNEKATVTVYIPTKNRRILLERAINSVLNQTYKKIQLIVVNDASTDDTAKYLKKLSAFTKNLTVINNEESKGACYSRNLAIKIADGLFITGLDDDDYFKEDRIERLVKNMEENLSFVSSSYLILRATQHEEKSWGGRISWEMIRDENYIGNQIMTYTSYLRELGGFNESVKVWQDYEIWLRLVKKFGPGKRIEDCSYVVDQTHEWDRITTSPKKAENLMHFLDVARDVISAKCYYRTLFEIEVMKNGRITKNNLKEYIRYIPLYKVLKYFIRF